MKNFVVSLMVCLMLCSITASAKVSLNKTVLALETGGAERLVANGNVRWETSDPKVVEVFQNGFVAGVMPGQAHVKAFGADANEVAECVITVESPHQKLVDPATLKQYPDSHKFTVDGRECYGSELNSRRASSPSERRFTTSNRVINPKPLRKDKPLEWEVQDGTEVYDGAGIQMGTVSSHIDIGGRAVPVSMFNFGMSKILNGRICLYAFAVVIKPSPVVAKALAASGESTDKVWTSAWLPFDRVVATDVLLERIGLGKPKMPVLALEAKGFRVTGGNPKLYMTASGEMSIVKDVASGPVPSHYLRRPSGTINLIYSVPGFGLGGQGTDSFLINEDVIFYPAQGAKVFKQPTYFPSRHPQAGKVGTQTMTFLYGAIKTKGSEPVYGWIAKEALAENAQ